MSLQHPGWGAVFGWDGAGRPVPPFGGPSGAALNCRESGVFCVSQGVPLAIWLDPWKQELYRNNLQRKIR